MKKGIISLLLLLFMFTGLQQVSFAQYEGEINFILQDLRETPKKSDLDLVFTKDRVYIESASPIYVMNGLQANSVLVRHDYSDFFFNTGEKEAFQIAKSDIDALANLISRVRGNENSGTANNSGVNWDQQVIETGNTRLIHGFETKEFILVRENENEQVSVWLTDKIKVDWGLLVEAWNIAGSSQVDENVPIELVMNRNSFPLLIEVHNNGKLLFRAESIGINSTTFDRSRTELAPDTKLLGMTDLMMNLFRQRR